MPSKLIFWNVLFHVCQFELAFYDQQFDHISGVIGGLVLSTGLLWGIGEIRFLKHSIRAGSGYLFFAGLVTYTFFGSFNWHFFGVPLTYTRFEAGFIRVLLNFASQGEVEETLDLFIYSQGILCLIALAAPLFRLPDTITNPLQTSGWKRYRNVSGLLGILLLSFSSSALNDSFLGFFVQSQLRQYQPKQTSLNHIPLKHLLPEAGFEPEKIEEIQIPGSSLPNILIVEYEGVGAMYSNSFGGPQHPDGILMKSFDLLARNGILASKHYSVNGGSSHGSDWSILTGLYPPNFGDPPYINDPWIMQKNLLSYMKQEGFVTGLFYSGFAEHREHIKVFSGPNADMVFSKSSKEINELRSGQTAEEKAMELMFKTIDSVKTTGDTPFMLVYRTYNAHFPYTSRARKKGMSKFERYMLSIRENDDSLGSIIDGLRNRGLLENTILIVTIDHGQAFRQHENLQTHEVGFYEELVRTPLLIHYPAGIPHPRVIETPTSHIDILPTILDIMGLTNDLGELEGYSLIRTIPENRTLFLSNGDDGTFSGLLQHGKKLIMKQFNSANLLFDLESDPLEKNDLAENSPEVVAHLKSLEKLWENHRIKGWGRSRYLASPNDSAVALTVSSSSDVTIHVNGKITVEVTSPKQMEIALQLREGRNFITVAGHDAGPDNTGLHIELQGGGSEIGTGRWWNISTSQVFLQSMKWQELHTDPKNWDVAPITSRLEYVYIPYRDVDWIDLPEKGAFVSRLDFLVEGGQILGDKVTISGDDKFRFYIGRILYGTVEITGRYSNYTFAFPRIAATQPEIMIEGRNLKGEAGIIVEGNIQGKNIVSTQPQWSSLAGISFKDWNSYGLQNDLRVRWQTPASLSDRRVFGKWSQQAEWLWSSDTNAERVLLRYNWGRGERVKG